MMELGGVGAPSSTTMVAVGWRRPSEGGGRTVAGPPLVAATARSPGWRESPWSRDSREREGERERLVGREVQGREYGGEAAGAAVGGGGREVGEQG